MEEIALIGIEHFMNKEVVHVVGSSKHNNLSAESYKSLNVKSVQCNRFGSFRHAKRFKKCGVKVLKMPPYMLGRGYPVEVNWKEASRHAPKMNYVQLLSKICKSSGPNNRGWPTTGILAIDLALSTDNPIELYLFGFDLYAQHYLVKKMLKHHSRKNPKSKMMFHHLSYLVNEFSGCKFICSSDVKIDQPNWMNV